MIESPLIAELLAEAEGKGEAKGQVQKQVKMLLHAIQKRFGEIPEELTATIRACADGVQLDGWLDAALDAKTLTQFRQQTGL